MPILIILLVLVFAGLLAIGLSALLLVWLLDALLMLAIKTAVLGAIVAATVLAWRAMTRPGAIAAQPVRPAIPDASRDTYPRSQP